MKKWARLRPQDQSQRVEVGGMPNDLTAPKLSDVPWPGVATTARQPQRGCVTLPAFANAVDPDRVNT